MIQSVLNSIKHSPRPIAPEIEFIIDTLALFEPELSQVKLAVVPEEDDTTGFEVLEGFSHCHLMSRMS